MKRGSLRKFIFNNFGDENFRRKVVEDNIYRLQIICRVFILWELWVIIVNIVSMIQYGQSTYNRYYLPVYGIFIVINFMAIMFFDGDSKLQHTNVEDIKKYEFIILAYVTVSMTWASVVSLMDQKSYGHLMVFMIGVMACSCFFILDAKKVILPYFISSVVLVTGLPFVQASKTVLVCHYYNFVLFIPVSFLLSRFVYNGYYENYESNMLLKKTNELLEGEIEINRTVNNQLKATNLLLKKLSAIDELTGIPNRRGFDDYLDNIFCKSGQKPFLISVIMMDVDNFKEFNDGYGHIKGDFALNKIACSINMTVGESDGLAVRWGGDEFLYIVSGIDDNKLASIARRIKKNVNRLKIPHEFSRFSPFMTISLGYATMVVNRKEDIEKCIKKADECLYMAKKRKAAQMW